MEKLPKEHLELQAKKNERENLFIQALKTLLLENIWSEELTQAYTQTKKWHGFWMENNSFPTEATLKELLEVGPPKVEKTIEGKKILLSTLALTSIPSAPSGYSEIHGDVYTTPQEKSGEPKIFSAPLLETVKGNLNLEEYDLAYLPKLQAVWGSLTLPKAQTNLPEIRLIGNDLTTSLAKTFQAKKLKICSGNILARHQKKLILPNLKWVGKSLKTENSHTLDAPKLEAIGRDLISPHLTTLTLPQLKSLRNLHCHTKKCHLPALTTLQEASDPILLSLSLFSINTLLKTLEKKSPSHKILKKLQEKHMKKLASLRNQQIGHEK